MQKPEEADMAMMQWRIVLPETALPLEVTDPKGHSRGLEQTAAVCALKR